MDLAGTYITSTDQFLAVTDERSLIEATDDPRDGLTDALSFDELEAGPDASLEAITAVLNEAVDDAEAFIDSYARNRYAVPLTPTDEQATRLAVRWAWITIRERRGILSQADADAARKELIRVAEQISNGTIRLVSDLTATSSTAAAVHRYGSAERRFGRDKFSGNRGDVWWQR